jgi:hypothetical protein
MALVRLTAIQIKKDQGQHSDLSKSPGPDGGAVASGGGPVVP